MRTLIPTLFCCFISKCFGQIWYSGDCDYAYPITNGYYNAPFYAIPAQLDSLEIDPISSCLSMGEQHGHWFEFWTMDTGQICFNIIPYDPQDDYDWALFDITNHTCYDIRSIDSLQVRCNYSNTVTNNGITGANGSTNNQDEPTLYVDSGQVFKLYLHNFNQSSDGFQLDFSCSTCNLNPAIGIQQEDLSSMIKIGPNPTTGKLNIYINQTILPQISSITVVDMYGKMIIPGLEKYDPTMVLDLTNMASGVYFLKVRSPGAEISLKLIRQ